MKILSSMIAAVAGLAIAQAALAADPPAGAPAGTTGLCKDGSYSSSDTKKGACRGHKGVKEWYLADDKSAKSTGKTATKPAEAKAGAAPAAGGSSAAAADTGKAGTGDSQSAGKGSAKSTASTKEAAPGGGAGKVWVNTSTNVYHCMGDRYYGKTKQGEYMSESDAKAKGAHADHNKACS